MFLYNDENRLDRSKVENYDLGSLRYVPIDKLAITRRYLRYSITSASVAG